MKKNIWVLLDGKRGHERQIEDLIFCLNKKIDLNIIKFKSIKFYKVLINFLIPFCDVSRKYSKPDLIIAAGHQTHLDALQKRNRFGGKVIIIMKPSLPTFLFDLSVVPFHDQIFWKKKIFFSNGPLTNIVNKKLQKKNKGIILVGGPSRHFIWNDNEVFEMIMSIISNNKKIKFTILTSRRTPSKFSSKLKNTFSKVMSVLDPNDIPLDWMEKNIGEYEYSWVTQDSISMTFEMLASGSKLTTINLKSNSKKINSLFDRLFRDKKLNFLTKVNKELKLSNAKESEAKRCASYIYNNFLN